MSTKFFRIFFSTPPFSPKMVPIPTWTPPADPRLLTPAELTECLPGPTPEARPFKRSVSGKFWKTEHSATVRTQQSENRKTATNWDKRQVARKKDESVKKIEKCVRTLLCDGLGCCCAGMSRARSWWIVERLADGRLRFQGDEGRKGSGSPQVSSRVLQPFAQGPDELCDRRRTITKERNVAAAEKARLEEMATRVSSPASIFALRTHR